MSNPINTPQALQSILEDTLQHVEELLLIASSVSSFSDMSDVISGLRSSLRDAYDRYSQVFFRPTSMVFYPTDHYQMFFEPTSDILELDSAIFYGVNAIAEDLQVVTDLLSDLLEGEDNLQNLRNEVEGLFSDSLQRAEDCVNFMEPRAAMYANGALIH